jgi:capsular polysaccharide biosynthesis protein
MTVELLSGLPAEARAAPIALVSRNGAPDLLGRLRQRLPDRRFVAFRVGPDLHVEMCAAGPFGAVVDVAGSRRWQRRLEATFSHLVQHGRYLIRWGDRDPEAVVDELRGMPASADVHQQGRYVVATNTVPALVKTHEDEHEQVLERRPDLGRVLASRPAVTYSSLARVRASRPPPLNPLSPTISAPAAYLRVYDGVTCLPGQVAFRGNQLLPASFRYPTRRRLRSTSLADLSPLFARDPRPEPERLPGTYFHIDPEIAGHFGHAVTELTSHLWGWAEAKARYPDLRALITAPPGGALPDWLHALLAAAGIGPGDLSTFSGPVAPERLVTASAMYSIGEFAHPDLRPLYDAMGARLAVQARREAWPERVFFTRQQHRRGCRNRDEVERLFADHGFTIVEPERLDLAEQIGLVRRASVVGGFAGSALLHIALSGRPLHVIAVLADTYHAHNEYQLASLLGHRLDLVVARADVPRPTERFSGAAYRSTFAVDLEGEGRWLRQVLEELDQNV